MIMNVGKIFPRVLGLIVQFDYCSFFFQFYTTGMKIRKKVRKKKTLTKEKK